MPMGPTERLVRIRRIARLLLEELPPHRASALLTRIHNQLPEEGDGISALLNDVHKELEIFVRAYAVP